MTPRREKPETLRQRAIVDDSTRSLWIPRRAPNLNDLIRLKAVPGAYNRVKRDWADLVFANCVHRGLTQMGPCSVHFELVEPNKRRDPDNLASGVAKLVLDGLVKAGVLEGDGWKHIAGLSFSWRVGSPAGVRVVLEPAERPGKVRGSLEGVES